MLGLIGHAPHGACELKFPPPLNILFYIGHAPHGACELKFPPQLNILFYIGHAPHGACELKCYCIYVKIFWWKVTLPTERVSGDVGMPSYTK